jgi:hypothetical protein
MNAFGWFVKRAIKAARSNHPHAKLTTSEWQTNSQGRSHVFSEMQRCEDASDAAGYNRELAIDSEVQSLNCCVEAQLPAE